MVGTRGGFHGETGALGGGSQQVSARGASVGGQADLALVLWPVLPRGGVGVLGGGRWAQVQPRTLG